MMDKNEEKPAMRSEYADTIMYGVQCSKQYLDVAIHQSKIYDMPEGSNAAMEQAVVYLELALAILVVKQPLLNRNKFPKGFPAGVIVRAKKKGIPPMAEYLDWLHMVLGD